MRSRERILNNLEQIYRETYEQARQADAPARMADLDPAEFAAILDDIGGAEPTVDRVVPLSDRQ